MRRASVRPSFKRELRVLSTLWDLEIILLVVSETFLVMILSQVGHGSTVMYFRYRTRSAIHARGTIDDITCLSTPECHGKRRKGFTDNEVETAKETTR